MSSEPKTPDAASAPKTPPAQVVADCNKFCKAGWQSIERCNGLLGSLKLPLLYFQQTLSRFHALDAKSAADLLATGGVHGRSLALMLSDALGIAALILVAAEAQLSADPNVDLNASLVMLQRQEQKILAVHGFLSKINELSGMGGLDHEGSWDELLAWFEPERMLTSGDIAMLWRGCFRGQFRAGIDELLKAISNACELSAEAAVALRPWLRPGGRSSAKEVELSDAAVVLDMLGLARGVAFCSNWEELCGHTYITTLWSPDECERRRVATAADISYTRRERQTTVLMPGWSREKLQGERGLLHALLALGMSVACDSDHGLVLQFEEASIADLLVSPSSRVSTPPPPAVQEDGQEPQDSAPAPAPMAGELTTLGKEIASRASPSSAASVGFAAPAWGDTPSACVAALVREQRKCHARDARGQHQEVLYLTQRRLKELTLLVEQVELVRERQREATEETFQRCDPGKRSGAFPKHQRAMNDLKVKEEQLALRKLQLNEMETSKDCPDQISHIRALLQEVAEAELELEQNRKWLTGQQSSWVQEEKSFQANRRELELACRQRLAAMISNLKRIWQRRWAARTEVARMERLLLGLEETFSSDRQRLHAYDEELANLICGKEHLLEDLEKQVELVKEQKLQAEAKAGEKTAELAAVQRVNALMHAKMDRQAGIEETFKKIQALQSKQRGSAGRF